MVVAAKRAARRDGVRVFKQFLYSSQFRQSGVISSHPVVDRRSRVKTHQRLTQSVMQKAQPFDGWAFLLFLSATT